MPESVFQSMLRVEASAIEKSFIPDFNEFAELMIKEIESKKTIMSSPVRIAEYKKLCQKVVDTVDFTVFPVAMAEELVEKINQHRSHGALRVKSANDDCVSEHIDILARKFDASLDNYESLFPMDPETFTHESRQSVENFLAELESLIEPSDQQMFKRVQMIVRSSEEQASLKIKMLQLKNDKLVEQFNAVTALKK